MTQPDRSVTLDSWERLRGYTAARIAIGHCGISVPTREHLSFQLCHALARDAVHAALGVEALKRNIDRIPGSPVSRRTLILHSEARDRIEYLQRPDLGRKLSVASREILKAEEAKGSGAYDIALVAGDGLSALAIETNAVPFLEELLPLLESRKYALSPICLVQQSRVAAADEIAFLLNARAAVILIGERPGLSSPDSMGIYMTWNPDPGVTRDDQRNCISNVRPEGMSPRLAAEKLTYLLDKSFRLRLSGVGLKDDQSESLPRVDGEMTG
ncbi:ethanolamine ammonia-lyase subunit EutC [Marispirochaeta sp.]|uniref:ethanolamine ammonia-lyase subunit EutC n=1 Tax=Marispirochaeta sp. TaxID=2038653 RepID=UPI0029C88256|nr:ethanolamine ammonia-lyase subunit EutC [Marispirochaeta sp.]